MLKLYSLRQFLIKNSYLDEEILTLCDEEITAEKNSKKETSVHTFGDVYRRRVNTVNMLAYKENKKDSWNYCR